MVVAFRSSQQVVNGTAGTSVVVSKPAGTVDGDVLVAFIARVGNTNISTAPSGWQLVTSSLLGAGSGLRLTAYYKVASGEPSSYTWTLASSVLNWGWVGAYTGVDPTSPVWPLVGTDNTLTGGTQLSPTTNPGPNTIPDSGMGIVAAAAVRTASGVATTWAQTWISPSSGNERADMSTNAGAGTDICGVVADVTVGASDTAFVETVTASQSQTDGVGIEVGLVPYFSPYGGGRLDVVIEAAFGADPDGDPTAWSWTDISDRVRYEDGITIVKGRQDEAGQADPTRMTFALNNLDGRFTPENPSSPLYPDMTRNVPVRCSLQGFGVGHTYERATTFVDVWRPSWDVSGKVRIVQVTSSGRLRRLQQGNTPTRSPAFRALFGESPVAYWACEDGADSVFPGNAVPGGQELRVIQGAVNFGAGSDLTGSASVLTHDDLAWLRGSIPTVTASPWSVACARKIPAAVAAEAILVEVATTGTARRWRLVAVPGSPDTLNVRAFDGSGTQILNDPVNFAETDYADAWIWFELVLTQNGANVDYQAWWYKDASGTGNTGTLASNTIGSPNEVAFLPSTELNGAGLGHVIVLVGDAHLLGHAGLVLGGETNEKPLDRFNRLTAEEGIPASFRFGLNSDTLRMGPQPIGKIVDLLREAEVVNAGVVHDGGTLGRLMFHDRTGRYDRFPDTLLIPSSPRDMTVNVAAGQLMPEFEPAFDDQFIRNDVTAQRPNGSPQRFVDDASVAIEGQYDEQVSVNTFADDQAYQLAGWRVGLGTVPGMRYPQIGINLRRSPELAQQWLACQIGSRITLTGLLAELPGTHPPDDIELFAEGWTEYLSPVQWRVSPINCTPSRPYDVFVLDGTGNTGRLDAVGSTLAAAVNSSATSLTVVTADGNPLWSKTDEPYDVEVGGERITVTAAADAVTDTFTRSVSNGWGTTDTGQTYTVTGTASDYAANGTKGTQLNNSVNVTRESQLPFSVNEYDITVEVQASATPTGAGYEIGLVTQFVDTSNFADLRLFPGTSGSVTIAVRQMVGGVETFDGFPTVSGVTATSNIKMRIQAAGSVLQGKAWLVGSAEPGWQVDIVRTFFTSGPIRLRSKLSSGNTNGSVTFSWDNLAVTNPQTFTVTRSVNGVVKAQSAGETVKLWRPNVLAL